MKIEKFAVPKFKFGYTVSYSIADEFKKRYNVSYQVIRNMPLQKNDSITSESGLETWPINRQSQYTSQSLSSTAVNKKIILYQGAVNEARGLENVVSAMQNVDAILYIYGDGNVYEKIKKLIQKNYLQHKIILKGKVVPEALQAITQHAYIGINLVEPKGLNQIYSLANKFFDYIHAGVPQVTMNFPEYKKVNDEFKVAILVNTVNEIEIASAINYLLMNEVEYEKLKSNCIAACKRFNWQMEERKLVSFYKKLFSD